MCRCTTDNMFDIKEYYKSWELETSASYKNEIAARTITVNVDAAGATEVFEKLTPGWDTLGRQLTNPIPALGLQSGDVLAVGGDILDMHCTLADLLPAPANRPAKLAFLRLRNATIQSGLSAVAVSYTHLTLPSIITQSSYV